MSSPLLRVRNLRVEFALRGGQTLRAVDDLSFDVQPGETLGIVGESGCGKSTLARAILRLTPIHSGSLEFDGKRYEQLTPRQMQPTRRAMRLVFQDPLASLNPRWTIRDAVREPLEIFEPAMSRRERDSEVERWLDRVGLGAGYLARYPHELSGGQNQRVSIARALIGGPRLVICDESVSALDVSIQAQILNLLADLQRETGIALLFISHDLSVVRHISRSLLVMYLGRMVEYGAAADTFANPRHPYTRTLLDAVPIADPARERARRLATGPTVGEVKGEAGSTMHSLSGCSYRPRCRSATALCKITTPALQHGVACHHALTPSL